MLHVSIPKKSSSGNSYKTLKHNSCTYVQLFALYFGVFNPLNAELNPICHLLALLGAHHILHVSGERVKGFVWTVWRWFLKNRNTQHCRVTFLHRVVFDFLFLRQKFTELWLQITSGQQIGATDGARCGYSRYLENMHKLKRADLQ